MATQYPNSLDSFVNPTGTDTLNSGSVPHAAQHANANDAIEAIQAELGTAPSGAYSTVKSRIEAIESGLTTQSVLDGLTDVVINNLQNGDILQYNGSNWVNTIKQNLVDGGNF